MGGEKKTGLEQFLRHYFGLIEIKELCTEQKSLSHSTSEDQRQKVSKVLEPKPQDWLGYLEGSGMYGAGAELVIVQQQVLEVSHRCEGVSRDTADGVLLQMQQHQVARQTLGDDTQVVIRQVQTLQAAQLAARREEEIVKSVFGPVSHVFFSLSLSLTLNRSLSLFTNLLHM